MGLIEKINTRIERFYYPPMINDASSFPRNYINGSNRKVCVFSFEFDQISRSVCP